jgi:hypothetical protein
MNVPYVLLLLISKNLIVFASLYSLISLLFVCSLKLLPLYYYYPSKQINYELYLLQIPTIYVVTTNNINFNQGQNSEGRISFELAKKRKKKYPSMPIYA